MVIKARPATWTVSAEQPGKRSYGLRPLTAKFNRVGPGVPQRMTGYGKSLIDSNSASTYGSVPGTPFTAMITWRAPWHECKVLVYPRTTTSAKVSTTLPFTGCPNTFAG